MEVVRYRDCGEEIEPGKEPQLAPGVRGYMVRHKGAVYVPLVIADRPGSGDVGRFLDGLDPEETWRFPAVVSPVLEDMLRRRGFRRHLEWDMRTGTWEEAWERPAQLEGGGGQR